MRTEMLNRDEATILRDAELRRHNPKQKKLLAEVERIGRFDGKEFHFESDDEKDRVDELLREIDEITEERIARHGASSVDQDVEEESVGLARPKRRGDGLLGEDGLHEDDRSVGPAAERLAELNFLRRTAVQITETMSTDEARAIVRDRVMDTYEIPLYGSVPLRRDVVINGSGCFSNTRSLLAFVAGATIAQLHEVARRLSEGEDIALKEAQFAADEEERDRARAAAEAPLTAAEQEAIDAELEETRKIVEKRNSTESRLDRVEQLLERVAAKLDVR